MPKAGRFGQLKADIAVDLRGADDDVADGKAAARIGPRDADVQDALGP